MGNNMNPFKLDMVSVRLVKDAPLYSETEIHNTQDAVKLLGEHLCDMDREVMCVINLKANGAPINCSFVSLGCLDEAIAHPREILKASILSNAASIIMLHNHPSGNLVPSKSDVALTSRMVQVCDLIGIPLLDHIIVGGDNSDYFSFNEKQILPVTQIKLETDYNEISFKPRITNLISEANKELSETSRNTSSVLKNDLER